MNINKIQHIFCFVLLVAAGSCFGQSLLVNGDFETGDFSGWTQFITANGTVGTPTVTSFATSSNGTASLSAAFQPGNNLANGSQQGGGIYQYFSLASVTSLAFSLNTASYATYANADGGQVSVLLDGITFDTTSFGNMGKGQTEYAILAANILNVSAGQHELEILDTRGFGYEWYTPIDYIDNVSLTVTTAPEPSSWCLLCLGIVFWFLSWRNRHCLPPNQIE